MRYCSEDAPRTGERNVNCNKKTTSENVVLNKMKKYDHFYSNFYLKTLLRLITCALTSSQTLNLQMNKINWS